MKAVMISIRPECCEKILNGDKTIEIRKTHPRLKTPFKCYIYCTKGTPLERCTSPFIKEWFLLDGENSRNFNSAVNGKVVAEFTCDKIIDVDCDSIAPFDKKTGFYIEEESGVSRDALWKYMGGPIRPYGWHISGLKAYANPRELDEFKQRVKHHWYDYCGIDKPVWEFEPLERAPQSWCYVEELEDAVRD